MVDSLDWNDLDTDKFADEDMALAGIGERCGLSAKEQSQVHKSAIALVKKARKTNHAKGMMESFLQEFCLSNKEGIALMCLAEALLRVPDAQTKDALIAEKIGTGDWGSHAGQSDSFLVNASTWGLMLTGKLIEPDSGFKKDPAGYMRRLAGRVGEPAIRAGVMQAMRIMGEQFVLGRSIENALKRGAKAHGDGALFSFDMLGEAACTQGDAARYFERYFDAIKAVGNARGPGAVHEVNGISVKLSALHPRYDARHEDLVFAQMYPKVLALAEAAAKADIGFCLDAEEADRLILQLKVLDRLSFEKSLAGWNGLGLAVQAYQKRSLGVLRSLQKLAGKSGHRFMVRLVKGAYWDSEIKHAQQMGMADFAVWTTKTATDLGYLACARTLLAEPDLLFAQFATHNAHTLAAVQHMAARGGTAIEFQRLHGMGEALYGAAAEADDNITCRIYAPVGSHEDLLPYLVRRLLENGANTSFVHSFLDDRVAAEDVAADPFARLDSLKRNRAIAPPPALFGTERRNAKGMDLTQQAHVDVLKTALTAPEDKGLDALPTAATKDDIDQAFTEARLAQSAWNARGGEGRAAVLRACADALEAHMPALIALMAREAGKTLEDGIAEVREAVDFCRYYAAQAKAEFAAPVRLPGPAGETNHYALEGRGIFVCISPWNFPLAIFTGQIMGALAAGNAVLAKPAEQTPRVAQFAVRLFHQAGVPGKVLHLLLGTGADVGAVLCADPRHDGVVFTGGTDTATRINRALAHREGSIAPLIAETGGLNAMVVDTSALREQVIDDVVASAFGSAGQRCSALRILMVPEETADLMIEGLIGAMQALVIGDPADVRTDIGPVIDKDAHALLAAHLERMHCDAKVLHQLDVSKLGGCFFGPALVEIPALSSLRREVFGPILHIVRYRQEDLGALCKALAAKGYGLTLGIHSRLQSFADQVSAVIPAGNVYVNRNMVGAVVGVQPFGGRGLSGTGPKAGGPHYLHRFATERTLTVNISAQGGDPELLSLSENF
ncbi:MAG: delta-1-pyrroline-5-carboxylate dehydrogenase [Robiginitomaculum sp.]|nr:MAG: delta-1-pyrroline-5-carboxylate dehydrogenase [Robiginitomaculum sp.]